ncbi:MAG: hypothetical protein AAF515_05685 [Pseudomonadota bacterium]
MTRLVCLFSILAYNALLAVPASGATLWSIFGPGCEANGYGAKRCRCAMNEIVRLHGEPAARAVGYDMILRYDEAAALRDELGEDRVSGASEAFDLALHRQCATPKTVNPASTTAATSMAADAAIGASTAGRERAPHERITLPAATAVLDLRPYAGEIIARVAVVLGTTYGGARNIRDHVGFFPVIDAEGGISTGQASLAPGDDDYPAAAQRLMGRPQLTIAPVAVAGSEQVLGEIVLQGGRQYAVAARLQGAMNADPAAALGGLANLGKAAESGEGLAALMKQLQRPSYLVLPFEGADNGYLRADAAGTFRFVPPSGESAVSITVELFR